MSLKHKVLFIDDDKHMTRIVRDFLAHENFEVHTSSCAEEGLKTLETLVPDIIVLDISMPGMGGIGFLKRISNPNGTLKHPVLVLTARAAMKEFFDTVAVNGFLPKPCSELDLIRKIREIIAESYVSPPEQSQKIPPAKQRHQIVLGEDDEDISRLYIKTLTNCGFDVYPAVTGPEVLEKAVALHPDIIVMKELLPNMNGSVVARLIKTMPNTRKIPIIVHDETRTKKPMPDAIQSVDMYLLSAATHDLIEAINGVLN